MFLRMTTKAVRRSNTQQFTAILTPHTPGASCCCALLFTPQSCRTAVCDCLEQMPAAVVTHLWWNADSPDSSSGTGPLSQFCPKCYLLPRLHHLPYTLRPARRSLGSLHPNQSRETAPSCQCCHSCHPVGAHPPLSLAEFASQPPGTQIQAEWRRERVKGADGLFPCRVVSAKQRGGESLRPLHPEIYSCFRTTNEGGAPISALSLLSLVSAAVAPPS